jgi:hypothetical protein
MQLWLHNESKSTQKCYRRYVTQLTDKLAGVDKAINGALAILIHIRRKYLIFFAFQRLQSKIFGIVPVWKSHPKYVQKKSV